MAASAEQVKSLREDTPPGEVKKRAGPGGMQLSYIDARHLYDVLDDKVGAENWQDQFVRDPKGLRAGIGILCERTETTHDPAGGPPTLRVYGEWVWKWDTGTPSSMEPEKGEYSDSLKRAGVHWGIARDLYDPSSDARTGVGGSASTPRPAAAPTTARNGSGGAPVGHSTSGWVCPDHGSFKVIPAGVSKKTQKAYPAFTVCPENSCEQKPPRGTPKPAPVFVAPAPDEFIGMSPEDEDDGNPFDSIAE